MSIFYQYAFVSKESNYTEPHNELKSENVDPYVFQWALQNENNQNLLSLLNLTVFKLVIFLSLMYLSVRERN